MFVPPGFGMHERDRAVVLGLHPEHDMSAIHKLESLGQSVWLDFIDRDLLTTGKLERLVAKDGVRGITSNPTIFAKAIASSTAYDDVIRSAPSSESDAMVLERIMVRDLALACDQLRPVYDETNGADGFASIEVDPRLAYDADAQVEQATRLWNAVNRPNLMVKIPATTAGVSAIERTLARGINVNVTLLFSVARYREVMEAHMRGLAHRLVQKQRIDKLASVASFFVSRVDTKIDRALDAAPNSLRGAAGELRGEVGIANAKIAYEAFEQTLASDRWKALAEKGAMPQRVLWASTSVKDPQYPDTMYVEALAGPLSIDTMTLETIEAYADHGKPASRVTSDRKLAHKQIGDLHAFEIDLAEISLHLEKEGVDAFIASFEESLRAIAKKRRGARRSRASADAHR